jgi:hypothetical protein
VSVDADGPHGALRCLQPGHRLTPRLDTRRVQQLMARLFELAGGTIDGFRIGDVELDAHLRHRSFAGPLRGPEARLGSL